MLGWKHKIYIISFVIAGCLAALIATAHGRILLSNLEGRNDEQLSYLRVKYEVEFLPINARLYNAGIHFAETGAVQAMCSHATLPLNVQLHCQYAAQTRAHPWSLSSARDWQRYSLHTFDYLTEAGWVATRETPRPEFASAFGDIYQKVWFAWTKQINSSTRCILVISNTTMLGLVVNQACESNSRVVGV